MSTEKPQRRPLSEIDMFFLTEAFSTSEGGAFDPVSGEVYVYMNGEILGVEEDEDGMPVEVNDDDWIPIDPVDSRDGFRDMADFVDAIGDRRAAAKLARALEGNGPFRRFRTILGSLDDSLGGLWMRYRDSLAEARAVAWLVRNELVDEAEAGVALEKATDASERVLEEAAGWSPDDD